MRYDLTDLRLFVNVAEEENVSRGAARTHLSPSSASLRIKGLEEAVGTVLMIRSTRGVKLTPAGRVLREHAWRCLAQLEQMHSDLQPYSSGLHGHITCFANHNAISAHLPQDLARFFEHNPNVRIKLEERSSHDIIVAIAQGRGDLGIAAVEDPHPSLTYLPYRQDRLVLLAPLTSELAKAERARFNDCLDQPFICLQSGAPLHTFLMNEAIALGRRLDVRVQVSGYRAIARLVSSGAGIGIAPSSALEIQDRQGLAVLKLDEPWAHRNLQICFRRDDEGIKNVEALRLIESLRMSQG